MSKKLKQFLWGSERERSRAHSPTTSAKSSYPPRTTSAQSSTLPSASFEPQQAVSSSLSWKTADRPVQHRTQSLKVAKETFLKFVYESGDLGIGKGSAEVCVLNILKTEHNSHCQVMPVYGIQPAQRRAAQLHQLLSEGKVKIELKAENFDHFQPENWPGFLAWELSPDFFVFPESPLPLLSTVTTWLDVNHFSSNRPCVDTGTQATVLRQRMIPSQEWFNFNLSVVCRAAPGMSCLSSRARERLNMSCVCSTISPSTVSFAVRSFGLFTMKR